MKYLKNAKVGLKSRACLQKACVLFPSNAIQDPCESAILSLTALQKDVSLRRITHRTNHSGCATEHRLGCTTVICVIDLVFNFMLICLNIFIPIKRVFKMRLDDSGNEVKSLSGLNNIVIISLTCVRRDGLFVSV